MEGAQGRFDGFMNSMQSSYDIVSSNRNELAGSVVTEDIPAGMLAIGVPCKAVKQVANKPQRRIL